MARPVFWPTNDSYTLGYDSRPVAGCAVLIFTAQVGGTQVTDLQYVNANGTPTGAVPSGVLISDANGLIPAFAGPDSGPTTLWGNHGYGATRIALTCDPTGTGGGGGGVPDDGSVTTPKLADGAVTAVKVAADVATQAELDAEAASRVSGLAGKASTTHASTHATGGTDVVTLGQAQVTGLTAALTAKADDAATTAALATKAGVDFANVTPATGRTALGLGTAATISATAGGDLSGTLPAPTVAKLNGITATGTPAIGDVLTATSTTAASWTAPAAGAGDATPTTKGVVQLAGDLAGTAAVPTVPGLAGKAATTTTVTAGTGLTGGGDLSANRTLTVAYGTTSTTATVGNDSRVVNAVQSTTITAIVKLTQAAYDAIGTPNAATLYVVVG